MIWLLAAARVILLAFALYATIRVPCVAYLMRTVDNVDMWMVAVFWALFAASMGWMS